MALDGVYKIRVGDVDGTVDYHIGEGKSKNGEKGASEDYYTANQETVEGLSQWVNPMGFGGISGGVRASDLKAVLHAVDPATGESAVDRRHPKRVAGLEWVYSVPKSLSAVWATTNKERAALMERSVLNSARASVIDWNSKGCKVRIGSGAVKVSATPVIAQMMHGASRNGDPQLHIHSISSAFAFAADGRAYAIDTLELTRRQSAEAARFHVSVAASMINEFGLAMERDGRNFKVGGEHAPAQELIDFWSSRRRDIEVFMGHARSYLEAKKQGLEPEVDPQVRAFVEGRKSQNPADYTFDNRPLARAIATFTKDAKDSLTQDEHREKWLQQALAYGFDPEKVFGQVEALRPLTETEKQRFIDSVLTEMFEKESAVSVYKVEQLFAEHAIGRMSLEDLDSCVEIAKQNQDLIQIETSEGYPVFTTAEKLSCELAIVDAVRVGQGQAQHQIDDRILNRAIEDYPTMEDEQVAAVRHACSDRGVWVIEGHAGAGKSYTMDAVRKAHEADGWEIIGIAQTGKAAKNLGDSAGMEITTVHGLLNQVKQGRRAIGAKTLVVCDEVGLIGSAQGAELLTMMREAGGKIGLVGDRNQMLAIQAGSLMDLAARETEVALLSNIRRQAIDPTDINPTWRRETSRKFAAGDVAGAMKEFDDRGFVRFSEDRDATYNAIAAEWREVIREGKSTLVLANTNADVNRLNAVLRAIRREDGYLTGEDFKIRNGPKKSDTIAVAIGDRLMTGKNDWEKGLINGAVGTVESIRMLEVPKDSKTPVGYEIGIKMDDGTRRTIDTRTYIRDDDSVYLNYADACTIYKAQGATVDRVMLYGTANLNQRLAYVGCTRHRESTTVHLNRDLVEEAYVSDPRNVDRGAPSDQDLRDYVDDRWSKKPEKAMALDHMGEQEARARVAEWQTRKQEQKLAIQAPEAFQAALAIKLNPPPEIKPLFAPNELIEMAAQRERIDRQIKYGSDRHVVVTYTQADAQAALDQFGDRVTLVKARPDQGLIGHQKALEAVAGADRVTVIHSTASQAAERERIDAQVRLQAGERTQVEHYRPEDHKNEKGEPRSYREWYVHGKAEERLRQQSIQARTNPAQSPARDSKTPATNRDRDIAAEQERKRELERQAEQERQMRRDRGPTR